jgi:protein-L-isoaspartate(D-aspartate) O-methyltransferase
MRAVELAFLPTLPHNAARMGIKGMFDSAAARRTMVERQILTADVHNPDLLAAMLDIPRERFLPPALAELAYIDGDIDLGNGRVLLKPMVLAKLIEAAQVRPDEHVLDLGCATGYSSAVLGRLAGSVVALEEDAELAGAARQTLAAAGATNVVVANGPLTEGWQQAAPYDFILLNGATEVTPAVLGRQLKPSGRLACIFGRPPAAKAMLFRLAEDRLLGRPIFDAAATVLPGFAAPPAFVF